MNGEHKFKPIVSSLKGQTNCLFEESPKVAWQTNCFTPFYCASLNYYIQWTSNECDFIIRVKYDISLVWEMWMLYYIGFIIDTIRDIQR